MSRQGRGIVGVSGSPTGGQGIIDISIPELVQSGGSLAGTSWPLNLPASGSQTQYALNVPYRFLGRSEAISWLAQFMGQGQLQGPPPGGPAGENRADRGSPAVPKGNPERRRCLAACRDCTHGLCVMDGRVRHHKRLTAEQETGRAAPTSAGAEARRNYGAAPS